MWICVSEYEYVCSIIQSVLGRLRSVDYANVIFIVNIDPRIPPLLLRNLQHPKKVNDSLTGNLNVEHNNNNNNIIIIIIIIIITIIILIIIIKLE